MAYRLPPIAVLRAFEAASRHLSFKKAAVELHVTPAAISQQIKALEDYLGVPLFRRLTRALELTDHARDMLPKVREGFECLAAAVESTRRPRATSLTVTAPPSFATHWLVSRLARFTAAHPEIALRLASSPDSIDRRGEAAVLDAALGELRDDASAVAIRYGTGSYPGFHVERIFAPDYLPVCAPALLAGATPLRTTDDLRLQVLIHDDTIGAGERQPHWAQWLKAAGVIGVDARRGPRFSNAAMALEAAVAGQGIALAARPLAEADVAAGRLVVPFDLALPSPYAYYLVMAKAIARREPVVAFRQWLLAEAAPA